MAGGFRLEVAKNTDLLLIFADHGRTGRMYLKKWFVAMSEEYKHVIYVLRYSFLCDYC